MNGVFPEWRRLLIKLLVIGLIVLITLLTLNKLYTRTSWYQDYISGLQEIKRFQSIPDQLDIINLGSSGAWFALDYNGLPVCGFNMGMSTQDFFYDYSLLRKYRHHLKPGAVVLICLSYQSFVVSSEAALKQSQFNEQKYYLLLEPRYINHFTASKWIQYKLFPVISAREHLLDIFHKPVKSEGPLEIDRNITEPGFARFARMEADRLKIYTSKLQAEIPLNRARLRRMISFCRRNQLKPVFLVTPYPEELNRRLGENFIRQNFYRFIEPWRRENIPYFDYSHDQRFSGSPELFFDPQHLNKKGRRLFTDTVIKELEAKELLPEYQSK